jgi:methanethiol S-methyltransferase
MYVRPAKGERDAIPEFGAAYTKYMTEVPGFIQRLGRLLGRTATNTLQA